MKQTVYDDILEKAIQGEIEAAQFYSDVAEKSDNAYLKDLFHTFSQEEKKKVLLILSTTMMKDSSPDVPAI